MLLRSFILAGAAHGLFFILLLKHKVKNSIADQVLMIWMGIITLQLSFYYDNLGATPIFLKALQLFCFSLPLGSAAVLYLYIQSLSFGLVLRWKRIALHIFPFATLNLLLCLLFYLKADSFSFKDGLPHFSDTVNVGLIYLITMLMAIVPGYYALLGLLTLFKYQKSLPDHYSYTERINLNWLKWMVISLLLLFIGLFLLIKYGVSFKLVNYSNLFEVVGAVLSLYVFFIGYFGLRQNTILHDISLKKISEEKESVKSTYKNSGLTEERVGQLYKQLQFYMESERPYLQEDLNLAALAANMSITSNQLSQVINQKAQTNFFNFINGYRVEAVKDKLKDPAMAHYSILGIAYDCGFSSKSSFNKIFKANTGQTPLQYQRTEAG